MGGGAEIVYNLYTFFGVGGGVVVSLHQRFDEGAALPGKPAMMYILRCMCGALVMTKLFY